MPQRINPYMVTSKASKTVDRHYQSLYQSHPLLCQTHVLWDDLSQLPQHMVSHYVDIEYHSLRVLHFSFRAVSLAAPHSPQFLLVLSQLRTALVQAMPPAPPPAAQRQPATPEARTRVEQQARRLFTTVFQLDSADEVNVPRFEWARVVLRLVQLQLVTGQDQGQANVARRARPRVRGILRCSTGRPGRGPCRRPPHATPAPRAAADVRPAVRRRLSEQCGDCTRGKLCGIGGRTGRFASACAGCHQPSWTVQRGEQAGLPHQLAVRGSTRGK